MAVTARKRRTRSTGVEDQAIIMSTQREATATKSSRNTQGRVDDDGATTRAERANRSNRSSDANASKGTTAKRARKNPPKNLHSFFNSKTLSQGQTINPTQAFTQRPGQKLSAPSDSIDDDLIEEILTLDEDAFISGLGAASSGSAPAVHLEKVNQQPTFLHGSKHRKAHIDQAARTTSKPWAEEYPPESVEELAVHPAKISAVRGWLTEALNKRPYRRLLVLKGPSGCGKTATVKTLTESLQAELVEWSNPTQVRLQDDSYIPVSRQFAEYLDRGSAFANLDITSSDPRRSKDLGQKRIQSRLLLIEEFPVSEYNEHLALRRLQETVTLHLESNYGSPAVMIISENDGASQEVSDLWTSRKLLGPDILHHPATACIEFNKTAAKFMSKAVDLVVSKAFAAIGRQYLPSAAYMRSLTSLGDIRSAIACLEMASGTRNTLSTQSAVPAKRNDRGRAKIRAQASKSSTDFTDGTREELLSLFHAIGKVVYNKRETPATIQPPDYLPEHHRTHAVALEMDQMTNALGADSDTFIGGLHENYVLSCHGQDTLQSIEAVSAELSSVDALTYPATQGELKWFDASKRNSSTTEHMRIHDLKLQLGIRGVLFALPYPVRRMSSKLKDSYKMQFPVSARIPKMQAELRSQISHLSQMRLRLPQTNSLASEGLGISQHTGVSPFHSSSWLGTSGTVSHRANFDALSPGALRNLDFSELALTQLPYDLIIGMQKWRDKITEELIKAASLIERNKLADLTFVTRPHESLDEDADDTLDRGTPFRDGDFSLVLSDDDIEDV